MNVRVVGSLCIVMVITYVLLLLLDQVVCVDTYSVEKLALDAG